MVKKIVLGVTQVDNSIDFGDFKGEGSSILDIFIPSANAYRYHYRDRDLPSMFIGGYGSLLSGDVVSLTLRDNDGNIVVSFQVYSTTTLNLEVKTIKKKDSPWYATDIGSGGGVDPDLESVLSSGNTTADGQTIDAKNGGGQLDLRAYDGDNTLLLSTDGGAYMEGGVYSEPTYTELFNYSPDGAVGVYTLIGDITIFGDSNSNGMYMDNDFVGKIGMDLDSTPDRSTVYASHQGYKAGVYSGFLSKHVSAISSGTTDFVGIGFTNDTNEQARAYTINILDNELFDQSIDPIDHFPSSVSSKGATMNAGVINSVLLGGVDLVASESETAYTPDISVQANKVIKTEGGTSQIELDRFTDNLVITNDQGAGLVSYLELGGKDSILGHKDTRVLLDSFNMVLESQDISLQASNTIKIKNLQTYADNASAISGGLSVDMVYKTSTGELRIVI